LETDWKSVGKYAMCALHKCTELSAVSWEKIMMRERIFIAFLVCHLLMTLSCSDSTSPPEEMIPDTDQQDAGAPPSDVSDVGAVDVTDEEPQLPSGVVDCPETIRTVTEGCDIEAQSSDFVLLRGWVLGPEVSYRNGGVLIDRTVSPAKILCAGCGCTDSSEAAGATVILCPDSVISPGLINPHDHITFSLSHPQPHGDERFEHRHDWRRGIRGHNEVNISPGRDDSREGILYGELRMLLGGATSVAGSIGSRNAQGLLRNLDSSSHSEGLTGVDVDYRTFPLGDSGGELRGQGCAYPDLDSESRLGTGIYLPHIAEGIDAEARNEFLCLSDSDRGVDLLGPTTSVIHGIGLTTADIAKIAGEGAKLVWSPRSNIDLYGNTARVRVFQQMGVTIALGTDWSASGSMNMLRELKCADHLNRVHYDSAFTDRDIWMMATANAAVAMGAADQVGILAEGFVADIAIFDATDASDYRAVIDADALDVQLVMRGGDPLVGLPSVIEALVPEGEIDGCETIEICDESRRLCMERDAGLNLETLRGAVSRDAYGLWFCGVPDKEPSCDPLRSMEYEGPTDDDIDGDGVHDDADQCPAVFDPVRPMDDGAQPDVDGDGTGDDCDRCPLDATDMCVAFDPTDRDADGAGNLEDNCPDDSNPGQEDDDGDGFGDACDPCPDFDNSVSLACPATIYEIRRGSVAQGALVRLENVLVLGGADDAGFFGQVSSNSPDFEGGAESGLLFYLGRGGVSPAQGDVLSVTGTVGSFGGWPQLDGIVEMELTSAGDQMPDPVTIDPAAISGGGTATEELIGSLVRVISPTVVNANPDAPDDFGEFEIAGGLRVDDLLYAIEPDPQESDTYAELIGVLHKSFGHLKLVPRGAQDIRTDPPTLAGIEPDFAFLRAGQSGASRPGLEIVLSGVAWDDRVVSMRYQGQVIGQSEVLIPAGSDRAPFDLHANTTTGFGTVLASLDGRTEEATVRVYDDSGRRSLVRVEPAFVSLGRNEMGTVAIHLNMPAPTGGLTLNVASSPNTGLIGLPTQITVPQDILTFDLPLSTNDTMGTETVTISLGSSSLEFQVEVGGSSGPCLLISEYLEGSGQNNKALELFHCGGGALDLANVGICLVSNDNTTCNATSKLPAAMLGPGEVYTVCRTKTGSGMDPVDPIKTACAFEVPGVANFNGDDRLLVFWDEDDDGAFDSNVDTVLDAFGQTAVRPAGSPWKDKTMRRCNFEPYDGAGVFDAATAFTTHAKDDATDYGVAPTQTCP
jgi:large repetitive protein